MPVPDPDDYAHRGNAPRRRYTKAYALAVLMHRNGVLHWQLRLATTAVQRETEREAGVRRCSDETWALTAQLLCDLEAGRLVPAPEHAEFCTAGHYVDALSGDCGCTALAAEDAL